MKDNEDVLRSLITDLSIALTRYAPIETVNQTVKDLWVKLDVKADKEPIDMLIKTVKELYGKLDTKVDKELLDRLTILLDKQQERKFKVSHLILAIIAAIIGVSSLTIAALRYLMP